MWTGVSLCCKNIWESSSRLEAVSWLKNQNNKTIPKPTILPPPKKTRTNQQQPSYFHVSFICSNFNRISPLKILIYSMDETFWNQLNLYHLYCWSWCCKVLGLPCLWGAAVTGLILSSSFSNADREDSWLYNCCSGKAISKSRAMVIASKCILHSRDWVGWREQWQSIEVGTICVFI